MTILLDESVPRLVLTQLSEFPITTVQEMGFFVFGVKSSLMKFNHQRTQPVGCDLYESPGSLGAFNGFGAPVSVFGTLRITFSPDLDWKLW